MASKKSVNNQILFFLFRKCSFFPSDTKLTSSLAEFILKLDFIGKPALLREKQAGSKKSFVTLKVKSNGFDAPYMSTLWFNNKIVGETTSGAWGYRVNQSVALGMLKIDLCKPGTEIEVEIYGERFPATVQDNKPLWDPENTRLRQ